MGNLVIMSSRTLYSLILPYVTGKGFMTYAKEKIC